MGYLVYIKDLYLYNESYVFLSSKTLKRVLILWDTLYLWMSYVFTRKAELGGAFHTYSATCDASNSKFFHLSPVCKSWKDAGQNEIIKMLESKISFDSGRRLSGEGGGPSGRRNMRGLGSCREERSPGVSWWQGVIGWEKGRLLSQLERFE